VRDALYRWLQSAWYGGGRRHLLLLPLTLLYGLIVSMRRWLYARRLLRSERAAVPVIVIGNLTAGGTGKTPATIWLAEELAARGHSPGIASRGYGGSKAGASMRVDANSDPAVVGDEPVLIARRTGRPVVVDADRTRAAAMLVEDGANLVIADDGLQHYALARDYEICVVDGARGLGNGYLMPAGPLREPVGRLREVDQVLVNGRLPDSGADQPAGLQNALPFDLVAADAARLNGSLTRPLDGFSGTTVHGVAAIGNPDRFFDLLRSHRIQVIEHAFPDHARLDPHALDFADGFDVLMTEKDAVKLPHSLPDRYWCVPVDVRMDPGIARPWLQQVDSRLREVQDRP